MFKFFIVNEYPINLHFSCKLIYPLQLLKVYLEMNFNYMNQSQNYANLNEQSYGLLG